MLSCSKLLCGILSSDIRPSGSVNRIDSPKQVILFAPGDGWVTVSFGCFPPSAYYTGSNSHYLFVM